MFEIIMMVCLAATGEQCTEYKVDGAKYEGIVSCIRDSQGKAHDWQKSNTKYTIMGTRCAKDSGKPLAPNAEVAPESEEADAGSKS